MGMVGALIRGAGQIDHIGSHSVGCGVGRPAAPEAMGEGRGASLLVSGQDAPGLALADAHEFSRLVQGNVLREEAVQYLKPGLFIRGQCHILHSVNVTFLLASWSGHFRWTSTIRRLQTGPSAAIHRLEV